MSISPINHYALTTAQPGVINEEAYTVLELVGKCGSKVNECVEAVNVALDDIQTYDDRIDAAQAAADDAQAAADDAASTANAALATATENGQRITNVSAVALEARSVAFSAQTTANALKAKDAWSPFVPFTDTPYSNRALTDDFRDYLAQIIAQLLNNSGAYYDLRPSVSHEGITREFFGFSNMVDSDENACYLISVKLKLTSSCFLSSYNGSNNAGIMFEFNQMLTAGASTSYGEGQSIRCIGTISIPGLFYNSETETYNYEDWYVNYEAFCDVRNDQL